MLSAAVTDARALHRRRVARGRRRRRRADIRDPATGEPVGAHRDRGTGRRRPRGRCGRAARRRAGRATHPTSAARSCARGADLIDARARRDRRPAHARAGQAGARQRARRSRSASRCCATTPSRGAASSGTSARASRADVRNVVGHAPVGVVAASCRGTTRSTSTAGRSRRRSRRAARCVVKPPPETPLAIGRIGRAAGRGRTAAGRARRPPRRRAGRASALVAAPRRAAHHRDGVDRHRAGDHARGGRAAQAPVARARRPTPFVVLDDADVEEAAAAAARRSFSNMGQICIAVNRDPRGRGAARGRSSRRWRRAGRADAHRPRRRAGRRVRPGAGRGGPRARAPAHIADAARGAAGAWWLAAGPLRGGDYDRGTFFAPTVLDDVPLDARVLTEETFGPVAAVHAARDDAELLRDRQRTRPTAWRPMSTRATSSGRGRSPSASRPARSASTSTTRPSCRRPFGGWKLSGIGRELGPEGLMTYLETRHLRMRVRPLA